jgi:hypothetical protein
VIRIITRFQLIQNVHTLIIQVVPIFPKARRIMFFSPTYTPTLLCNQSHVEPVQPNLSLAISKKLHPSVVLVTSVLFMAGVCALTSPFKPRFSRWRL